MTKRKGKEVTKPAAAKPEPKPEPKTEPAEICSVCQRKLTGGAVEVLGKDPPICFVCFLNEAYDRFSNEPLASERLVLLFAITIGCKRAVGWLNPLIFEQMQKEDPERAQAMLRKLEEAGKGSRNE